MDELIGREGAGIAASGDSRDRRPKVVVAADHTRIASRGEGGRPDLGLGGWRRRWRR